MNYRTLASIIILFASATSLPAQERDPFFQNAGLRFGQDLESNVNLQSYEIFCRIDTSLSWNLSENITLDLDIETAVGALTGEGDTAAYFRIAPLVEITFGDSPVSIVASAGPSFHSEDVFGSYDIGGAIQFTSSIGFNWRVCENWTVSYRFQHTSNATIEDPNPGLNMHTLGVSYKF